MEINLSHKICEDDYSGCGWCTHNFEQNDELFKFLKTSSFDIHCPKRKTVGIDRVIGGTSPYLILPRKALIPVPTNCPVKHATLAICEPLAAALQAIS